MSIAFFVSLLDFKQICIQKIAQVTWIKTFSVFIDGFLKKLCHFFAILLRLVNLVSKSILLEKCIGLTCSIFLRVFCNPGKYHKIGTKTAASKDPNNLNPSSIKSINRRNLASLWEKRTDIKISQMTLEMETAKIGFKSTGSLFWALSTHKNSSTSFIIRSSI